jgi:SAM-dependent methyltransferase
MQDHQDAWDWIQGLGQTDRVLDLGAGVGSLKALEHACSVVSVDCDHDTFVHSTAPASNNPRVLAWSQALPFASSAFDLVLCHHVLEHVEQLSTTLSEIARVLKPAGRLYVAVPNGYGLCDRIYRYIFEGGDHVNRFKRQELTALVERTIDIRLTYWVKLYSSFAYLARVKDLNEDILPSLPNRLRRLASVPAGLIAVFQGGLYLLTRLADRLTGVDWALYGWAFYFERENPTQPREGRPYINVCLYCGSGHQADQLRRTYLMLYTCPTCNHFGIYLPPYRNGR